MEGLEELGQETGSDSSLGSEFWRSLNDDVDCFEASEVSLGYGNPLVLFSAHFINRMVAT